MYCDRYDWVTSCSRSEKGTMVFSLPSVADAICNISETNSFLYTVLTLVVIPFRLVSRLLYSRLSPRRVTIAIENGKSATLFSSHCVSFLYLLIIYLSTAVDVADKVNKSADTHLLLPCRGTSIQWALPMLSQLLPEHLLARVQSTAVDPNTESPEHGDLMPAYNAQTGEVLKV